MLRRKTRHQNVKNPLAFYNYKKTTSYDGDLAAFSVEALLDMISPIQALKKVSKEKYRPFHNTLAPGSSDLIF